MNQDNTLRFPQAVLALVAVVLAGAAMWLAFDNPAIDNTSRGDGYTCLAPWDSALNDADNYPGGEPPPDGDQIAARCREAGEERFEAAVVCGVAAAMAGIAAGVIQAVQYCRAQRLRT